MKKFTDYLKVYVHEDKSIPEVFFSSDPEGKKDIIRIEREEDNQKMAKLYSDAIEKILAEHQQSIEATAESFNKYFKMFKDLGMEVREMKVKLDEREMSFKSNLTTMANTKGRATLVYENDSIAVVVKLSFKISFDFWNIINEVVWANVEDIYQYTKFGGPLHISDDTLYYSEGVVIEYTVKIKDENCKDNSYLDDIFYEMGANDDLIEMISEQSTGLITGGCWYGNIDIQGFVKNILDNDNTPAVLKSIMENYTK